MVQINNGGPYVNYFNLSKLNVSKNIGYKLKFDMSDVAFVLYPKICKTFLIKPYFVLICFCISLK